MTCCMVYCAVYCTARFTWANANQCVTITEEASWGLSAAIFVELPGERKRISEALTSKKGSKITKDAIHQKNDAWYVLMQFYNNAV
jgi:hypothetical protein